MDHDAYHHYHAVNLHAQTANASPVQLVLILLDGLLEELARTRAHIAARRYTEKAQSLGIPIIDEATFKEMIEK